MKLQLQILPHQTNAVNTVNEVFHDVLFNYGNINSNPTFNSNDVKIKDNIQKIQNGEFLPGTVISKLDRKAEMDDILGIDVKMETGTGKTYAYTRVMYELHKNYGFNKFIILVPTTPIKEGTKKFIESDYAREHFADLYPNIDLQLEVLDPMRANRGKKKMFPSAISNFSRGTRLEGNRINTLLMTSGMLLSASTMERNYDQTLFGSITVPMDALRETRPVVIIDEPHRFKKENKAYKKLVEKIHPQVIIRFGATFPKDDNTNEIDYNNLVYNLNAIKAFNDGLVKGVSIQTPESTDKETKKVKLLEITSRRPKVAIFRNEESRNEITVGLGENLSSISPEFRGLTLEKIGKIEENGIKKGVALSNGTTLAVGESVFTNIYSDNYQDIMLKQALKNHFDLEKDNFNRQRKIKTLTLFFIDSVYSYRGEDNNGYLKVKFESFLKAELKRRITKLEEERSFVNSEYLDFLKASLTDLTATNGGYFSVDNSTDDDKIKEEIDAILRDKEKLLSYKNEDGTWNTIRFIFSKWTLREGWDNPNIFQIAKLRSSGSEISKLQEVGRGLRLPVDEYGNRISDEEFYLTYLVDFSDENFANTLVSEINSDIAQSHTISDSDLQKVAEKRNVEVNDLFIDLLTNKFIDRKYNIIDENREDFFIRYPEFNKGLKPNKVLNKHNKNKNYVNIRPHKFKNLKSLWENLNKKYYVKIEDLSVEDLQKSVLDILNDGIYSQDHITVTEKRLSKENQKLALSEQQVGNFITRETIPYNEFLKKLHKNTNLPILIIHRALIEYSKSNELEEDFFNIKTLSNFINKYREWVEKTFVNRFSYKKMDVKLGETALTNLDGSPREKIIQGNIGVYKDFTKKVPENFLYDSFVYDSDLEKLNIERSNIEEVVVFGKIPRRSIQVPLYFGGTTSPDFMYVLQKEDKELEINLIIETKDVDSVTSIRGEEKLRIESARKFFELLKEEGLNVKFEQQIKKDEIIGMLKKIIDSK